uniref:Protein kinase domain-containing protein n=1 Tax=Meloidogyne hapla TaxID=6305 RepID=A0A1I8AXN7_MELHA
MKIFDFLLAALLVNFFHLNLFLCEGANVETETAEASTSQDGNKCPCRYSISKLIEITLKLKISGNQKEEKTILKKSKYPLGSGRYGKVYHAYWPDRKYCVAIKVVKRSKIFIREATKNEVEIHEYINENVTHRQRDYIIEMYG